MGEFPDPGSPSEMESQRQVSLALDLFVAEMDAEPPRVELVASEDGPVPPPPFRDTSDSDCACT
jgi:hypothetical protein